MKYLLLLALFAVLWWRWKKHRYPGAAKIKPAPERAPERVLACAHCGLFQPAGDCLMAGEKAYCCAAHLAVAESGKA